MQGLKIPVNPIPKNRPIYIFIIENPKLIKNPDIPAHHIIRRKVKFKIFLT